MISRYCAVTVLHGLEKQIGQLNAIDVRGVGPLLSRELETFHPRLFATANEGGRMHGSHPRIE